MIPASSPVFLVLDAAVRSLLLAATVAAGLALFRVRNVVAQKAAWTLVLVAVMLMPVLAPWAARIPIPWLANHATFVLTPERFFGAAKTAPPIRAAAPAIVISQPDQAATIAVPVQRPAKRSAHKSSTSANRFTAPPESQTSQASEASQASIDLNVPVSAPMTPSKSPLALSPVRMAILLYIAVCVALLGRLAYGTWAAARLWNSSEPVAPGTRWILRPGLACKATVRTSKQIASPITIGSDILLPDDYREWDAEKLRIVLAHESSHVRQRDFYLQICASIYIALFWFSPLGWWLKRRLSDLSETISDGAAVQHAASHASYAQVLLQFAAAPRPIQFGVAMARHRRLIPRIERLLNENSFRQAFSGGRTRIVAAILLVPIALFAATTMVRVQAAGQQAANVVTPAPQPIEPPDALSGTSTPAQLPGPGAPQSPAAPQSPSAPMAPPAEGSSVIPPGSPDAPPPPQSSYIAPGPPSQISAYGFGSSGNIVVLPQIAALKGRAGNLAIIRAQKAQMLADMAAQKGRLFAFKGAPLVYGFGNDGDSYAFVTGEGEKNIHFIGNWFEGSPNKAEIEKARKVAHGDFIWFERDGKSYVIDDESLLTPIKLMQATMDSLGKQQEDLGKKQEELGRQQEELGRQQEQASVPTPDMSKELASLNESIAKLNALKGGTVTAEQLGDLEGKLGDLQGKIGDIEGRIGEKQGELGGRQGKLGDEQGRLGEQQGKLGAEQGRIARQMDGKVLTMIDECLKNGKARPVE